MNSDKKSTRFFFEKTNSLNLNIIGITGATSNLGKSLVNVFLSKNFKVKIFVRNIEKAKKNIEEFEGIINHTNQLSYCQGDIANESDVYRFIEGIDLCYHIAAQVEHASKYLFYKTNVVGTKNICKAILNRNNKCKLIYCSSIATLRVTPFNKPLQTDYTKSKYYAEKIVTNYMHRINACIIYPGLIYGPHDRSLIPQFLQGIKNGISFLIKGGEKNIPLVYIDDLVDLFYQAGLSEKSKGQKYISVKNSEIGIHSFIQKIAEKANLPYSPPQKKYPRLPLLILAAILEFVFTVFRLKNKPALSKRSVDILSLHYKNNCSKAKEHFGWEQKYTIDQGLEKTFEYYNTICIG